MQKVTTLEDYERLSWHDNEIRGLEFRVGNPENEDWTSDLGLDIDHIVEWVAEGSRARFRIAPATLIFHGVTDLDLGIECETGGSQTSLLLPSIAQVDRVPITDQRVFLDRPYYRWRIRLNGTPAGEISFGAWGFTQTLRADPVWCDELRLDRNRIVGA